MAENRKGTELIETEEGKSPFDMSLVASSDIIAVAEQAEKRLAALVKIKMVALKATNPGDWVNENDNPYLQASGGEKVGRIFGISWRISEPTKEDLGGGHYAFTYTGEFLLWGSVITAVGTRSSKDPFFKKYKYAGDERVELPVSEIDPGDVKKAAYTNLIANGVTRVLGIRNLTWEDLKQYAGISKEQVRSVQYKKGGKSTSSQGNQSKREARQTENGMATEDQVNAIHSILTERLEIKGQAAMLEKLSQILGLKALLKGIGELSKAQASQVITALQKEVGGGG
jgi:hypothetical protein